MTQDELMALREVPLPDRAVWRQDGDPVQIWEPNGRAWTTFRIKGKLVRARDPRNDFGVGAVAVLEDIAPKTCQTCKHWGAKGKREYCVQGWIGEPIDPDTYKPMVMPFVVKNCGHPELLFCERPLRADGFAVADGSEYAAALYTAEKFGCVLHEEGEPC